MPRPPRRGRSWNLERLEDRRLPSHAVEPLVTLPGSSPQSTNMVSGLDGDLWVGVWSSPDSSAIDRISLDGSVASFAVPGGVTVDALTNGPDGNVWFVGDLYTASGNGGVVLGNVTPAGQVTEFPPIPTAAGQDGASYAMQLVDGPDHDLWFSYSVMSSTPPELAPISQDFIGRATTAGAVTLFPVSSSSTATKGMYSLASGADGNLWFTEQMEGQGFELGRMSPGGVVTTVPIGKLSRDVLEVANGPNGVLILTAQTGNFRDNRVYRMTTAGAMTSYRIPAAISTAFAEYLGPADRSLWFTSDAGASRTIGRIAASGAASSDNLSGSIPGRDSQIQSITLGGDGRLYVLVQGLDKATVYRLAPGKLR